MVPSLSLLSSSAAIKVGFGNSRDAVAFTISSALICTMRSLICFNGLFCVYFANNNNVRIHKPWFYLLQGGGQKLLECTGKYRFKDFLICPGFNFIRLIDYK